LIGPTAFQSSRPASIKRAGRADLFNSGTRGRKSHPVTTSVELRLTKKAAFEAAFLKSIAIVDEERKEELARKRRLIAYRRHCRVKLHCLVTTLLSQQPLAMHS
jgi:hypothetical protein